MIHSPFGWGTSGFDYDNDGDTDILFHGGFDFGVLVATAPGVLLQNQGDGTFERDMAAMATTTDHVRRNVRGVAVGDLDNNGFVDMVSVSNFDYPVPIELEPAYALGGQFDIDAYIVRTFTPIDPNMPPLATAYTDSGLELPDGTLSVEINSADNQNGWVQIETLGTVGLIEGSRTNRDGIGAIVHFEPSDGQPVMQPILGGSSIASQDSLIASLGLGAATTGTVDVVWQNGVRNRLYGVQKGERILFPEIPCNIDDQWGSVNEYRQCVFNALDQLRGEGVISPWSQFRFLLSAYRAYGG